MRSYTQTCKALGLIPKLDFDAFYPALDYSFEVGNLWFRCNTYKKFNETVDRLLKYNLA